MDRLWAPWRKAYIRPKAGKKKGCLFCRLLAENKDVKNSIVKRTPHCFAVLNIYPYNNGHIMIVPRRHVDSTEHLNQSEKLDWLALYEKALRAMKKNLRPDGFNAGMNLGRQAGAGIPKHLHLHVVPRWKGDVNFMPVLSDTRVISESLESVYHLMARELQRSRK